MVIRFAPNKPIYFTRGPTEQRVGMGAREQRKENSVPVKNTEHQFPGIWTKQVTTLSLSHLNLREFKITEQRTNLHECHRFFRTGNMRAITQTTLRIGYQRILIFRMHKRRGGNIAGDCSLLYIASCRLVSQRIFCILVALFDIGPTALKLYSSHLLTAKRPTIRSS